MKTFLQTGCLLLLSVLLASCATPPPVRNISDQELGMRLADKPAALRDDYRRLLTEDKSNEGLNRMRLGLNAFKLGFRDVAKESFDRVVLNIESFYADTEASRKARSLWYEEGMKDFKGEPYERVMAYYYRGLLFLEDGDYQNARAAYKSAVLQDAFAEEEQFRADFALAIFLEGLSTRLAGDRGAADAVFEELKKFRPDFSLPKSFNVIVIAESGTSPRKVADGPGHSELKYRRGRNFTEKRVEIAVDGGDVQELYPMEDIFFQAATRGGRQIDKILKDKVVFRQTNIEIGSSLSAVASDAMLLAPLTGSSMGTVQAVAGGVAVIGAVQQYMAINAKPHADTRYWDNLPDTVHVGFAQLPQGRHQILFGFKDENGTRLDSLTRKVDFEVNAQWPVIVWAKSR